MDNFLVDKNSFKGYFDEFDVVIYFIGVIGSIEENLVVFCMEVLCGKVEENFEELKVVVEELFMFEWEDDDLWWESDSCLGQSFLFFSSEIIFSSLVVMSLGFIKCLDFYSVIELKKKL